HSFPTRRSSDLRGPLARYAGRIELRSRSAAVAGGEETFPDRLRGLDRDLLADDGARERGERVSETDQMQARLGGNQRSQNGVARGEHAGGVIPVVRLGHGIARRRCCTRAVAATRNNLPPTRS